MSLEQAINNGIKEAMKAKDQAELRGLRAIKSAILLAKTATGGNHELDESAETKLLQKLAKQGKDSLEIYRSQQREDLAQKEAEELAVFEKFLPRQMNEQELREALTGIISATGAASPADMGKVMGVASRQLAGRADGKAISTLVKEMLGN